MNESESWSLSGDYLVIYNTFYYQVMRLKWRVKIFNDSNCGWIANLRIIRNAGHDQWNPKVGIVPPWQQLSKKTFEFYRQNWLRIYVLCCIVKSISINYVPIAKTQNCVSGERNPARVISRLWFSCEHFAWINFFAASGLRILPQKSSWV